MVREACAVGLKRPGRFWAQVRAAFTGYFWLPCSLCGEYMAGFEWDDGNSLLVSPGRFRACCRGCGPEARKRNAHVVF